MEVSMFFKRLGFMAVLLGLLVLPLSASMVSFMVVETGQNPDAINSEYSMLWEDGLMGAFFDAGHIVSNSPILRLNKPTASDFLVEELPGEARRDFVEASEGGADYFILAVLEFTTQNGRTRPQLINIRIFTINGCELVYENLFPAGTGVNLQDEAEKARDAARIIAAQIKDI